MALNQKASSVDVQGMSSRWFAGFDEGVEDTTRDTGFKKEALKMQSSTLMNKMHR